MSYDHLRDTVMDDSRFITEVNSLYHSIIAANPGYFAITGAAEQVARRFGMNVHVHDGPVLVFTLKTSRAKRPACITAAPRGGSGMSPCAMMYRNASACSLQVFEAGADDTDTDNSTGMATDRPDYIYRVVTQDRVLFC